MTSHPHDHSSTAQRQQHIDAEYSRAIQDRRQIAFHGNEPADWKDAQHPVGMALSGGGLRSALFNVGLLQACAHRGLLRYIDYLSSVSGGGYASGWLMSMHAAAEKQATAAEDASPSFHARPEARLGVDPHSEQVSADYLLGNSGSYLNKPIHFLWQYVALTVPLLVLFLGGLFAITAVLALIWRSLDQEANRTVLTDLGFLRIADEFFIAILPALMMTCAWSVALVSLVFPERKSNTSAASSGSTAETGPTKWSLFQSLFSAVPFLKTWWLPVLSLLLIAYEVCPTIAAIGPLVDFSLWLVPLQLLMSVLPLLLLPWGVWCWHRRANLEGTNTLPRGLWQHPATYFLLYVLLLIREPITAFLVPKCLTLAAFLTQWFPSVSTPLAEQASLATPLNVALWPVMSVVPGMWRSHVTGGLIALGLMVYSLQLRPMAQRTACCRILFLVTMLCWAVSIGVFLGNGESRLQTSQETFQLNQFATVLAVLATVLQLLPAFFSRQLLNSDREDSSPLQRGTYVFLTWVAPVFVFFAVAHVMSRENISGYATYRDSDLLRTDVLNWSSWDQLRPILEADVPAVAWGSVAVGDQEKFLQGGPSEWKIHDQQPVFSFAGCGRVLGQWLSPYTTTLDRHLVDHWELRLLQRDAVKNSQVWLEDPELSGRLTVRLLKELEDNSRFITPLKGNPPAFFSMAWLFGTSSNSVPQHEEKELPPIDESNELPAAKTDALDKWIAHRRGLMETDWTSTADKKFRKQLSRALRPDYGILENPKQFTGSALQIDLAQQVSATVRGWSKDEIADWNRLLLEILEPRTIRPREMVTTGMMTAFDQRARFGRFLFFGILCWLAVWRVDFNRSGAFYRFYRSQLSLEFLGSGAADDQAGTQPLSALHPHKSGLAIPLYCAARLTFPMLLKGYHNPPRSVVFSPISAGWQTDTPIKAEPATENLDADQILRELEQSIGRNENWWLSEPMSHYADRANLTLADAVTVSGSAVTPLAVPNWPLAVILTMLNLRLGRWLPGPFLKSRRGPTPPVKATCSAAGPPAPAREVLRTTVLQPLNGLLRPGVSSPNYQQDGLGPYFVADGGFDDFLGAMELLRRRCRLIIISDAGSNSGKNEFGSLSHLIRAARQELGVRFYDLDSDTPLVLDRYRRSAQDASRVPQQFFCCRAVYPAADGSSEQPQEALVLYLQMSLTGREEIDLQQFRLRFPNFPDEPIQNQVYTPQQVEAYRQLGYHIGRLICGELPPWLDSPDWTDVKGDVESEKQYHPVRRVPLSFGELKQRLQLAFFWECHRERMFEQSEVSAGRMFTMVQTLGEPPSNRAIIATESWTHHLKQSQRDLLPRQLLTSYETDSDIRQAIRSEIYNALCTNARHADDWPTFIQSLERELIDQQISASMVLLPTIAMAVNDLLVYDESRNWIQPTLDEGIWERTALDLKSDTKDSKSLPLRNPFKIGGRELLIAQRSASTTEKSEEEQIPERLLISELDASQLYRVAYDIFREHGPATALLTVRCLKSLLGDLKTQHPSRWAPNIPVARSALHRRDCNAFVNAVLALSESEPGYPPESGNSSTKV